MSYRNDAELHVRYGQVLHDEETEALINSSSHLNAVINNFAVNNKHLAKKSKEYYSENCPWLLLYLIKSY